MKTARSALRGHIAGAGRWFLLLSVLMSLALPYWMVVRAGDVLSRPENVRPLEEEARGQRGRILDSAGQALARTELDAGGYARRVYTSPALAHVTGYWSLRYGVSGIEAARNDDLRGGQNVSAQEHLVNTLLHRPTIGDDVVLTIDSNVQKAADEALGTQTGAVVVLDARSGAVLAMASRPYFDPNRIDDTVDSLKQAGGQPLLNRATQGLYTPGSTFKTVTLAAALELGVAQPSTVFTYTLRPPDAQHHGWWHVGDQKYLCENHPANNAPFDLTSAYIWSCNVTFGDLGLAIGADRYNEMARRFGLGRPLLFDLPTALSRLYATPDYLTGQERYYALASTAFGQGEVSVTPLQMALVAAAVANDGKMPRPYLVARVQTAGGRTTSVTRPQTLATVMSSATADAVRRMMVESVSSGWAQSASLSGVSVGGKTGTAEISSGQSPHSWFIGFAPGDSPRYAIAVIMENAGYGSSQAGPAARKVMEALIQQK